MSQFTRQAHKSLAGYPCRSYTEAGVVRKILACKHALPRPNKQLFDSLVQCRPNAANMDPETYPKFQQQLDRVTVPREMIIWRIQQPLELKPLVLADAKIAALAAYIAYERRGVALAPCKD